MVEVALFLLVFVPISAVAYWASRAQVDYLRRYREVHGLDFPIAGEEISPSEGIKASISNAKRSHLLWEPQPEAEIEAARRRAVRRYYVGIAALIWGSVMCLLILWFLSPAQTRMTP
jgi:hypothetical protein